MAPTPATYSDVAERDYEWLLDDHPLRSYPTECGPELVFSASGWYHAARGKGKRNAWVLGLVCLLLGVLYVDFSRSERVCVCWLVALANMCERLECSSSLLRSYHTESPTSKMSSVGGQITGPGNKPNERGRHVLLTAHSRIRIQTQFRPPLQLAAQEPRRMSGSTVTSS